MIDANTLYAVGIVMVFIGILIIIAFTILAFVSDKKENGNFNTGGAIIIGPFPIVYGTDRESIKQVLLLSIILTILLIAAMAFYYFMPK